MAKTSPLLNHQTAAVVSLSLFAYFFLFFCSVVFDFQPLRNILTVDGFEPTLLGRVVMLTTLLAIPLSFVISMIPMVGKASSKSASEFKPSQNHIVTGLAFLVIVMIVFAQGVLYELRPFVNTLGSGRMVGQVVYFLILLVLPLTFLFNRVPRFPKPASLNLIVGAAILLAILMIVSTFALESTACSIGVPNCD